MFLVENGVFCEPILVYALIGFFLPIFPFYKSKRGSIPPLAHLQHNFVALFIISP